MTMPAHVQWHFELVPAPIRSGEVGAWLLDLEREDVRQLDVEATGWLSPEECERAARLHFPDHCRWFQRGRLAARYLLSGVLGLLPGQVRLGATARGKPILCPEAPGNPVFNWSRSGRWFLFGLAGHGHLGVDVECWDEALDVPALAAAQGSAHLVNQLAGASPEARLATWYRLWTAFEARAKAGGEGIAAPESARFWAPTAHERLWQREFQLAGSLATATVALLYGDENRV